MACDARLSLRKGHILFRVLPSSAAIALHSHALHDAPRVLQPRPVSLLLLLLLLLLPRKALLPLLGCCGCCCCCCTCPANDSGCSAALAGWCSIEVVIG
jgi:hypothetical protein